MSDIAPLGVKQISTHFIHLIETESQLSEADEKVISSLLTYGPKMTDQELSGVCCYVVPRVGTISPWSSKATDIAHICGLDNVIRIERGIEFQIEFERSSKIKLNLLVCFSSLKSEVE